MGPDETLTAVERAGVVSQRERFAVAIREWAASYHYINRAWIFGSYVSLRRKPTDLDVAVELLDTEEGNALSAWICNAERLRRALGLALPEVVIDLQPAFVDDERVSPSVQRSSVLVFARPLPV